MNSSLIYKVFFSANSLTPSSYFIMRIFKTDTTIISKYVVIFENNDNNMFCNKVVEVCSLNSSLKK